MCDEFKVVGPHPGDMLEEANYTNELDLYLPDMPGVYLWSRRLSPPTIAVSTADAFVNWLEEELGKTQGVVSDSLAHLGNMRFELGGASINEKKKQDLKHVAKTRSSRKALKGLLQGFDYSMVLYVGQTDNLRVRVSEHLSNRSGFSVRLSENKYEWDQVGLKYIVLPEDWTKQQRESLERSLAILTLAPATSRAG